MTGHDDILSRWPSCWNFKETFSGSKKVEKGDTLRATPLDKYHLHPPPPKKKKRSKKRLKRTQSNPAHVVIYPGRFFLWRVKFVSCALVDSSYMEMNSATLFCREVLQEPSKRPKTKILNPNSFDTFVPENDLWKTLAPFRCLGKAL